MSTHGPHQAAKEAVAPDPGKPPSTLQTTIQLFTAISLFFVIMTPVMYLAGRAYHDGYYNALQLDQSMFPLDNAGTLTEGAIALGMGFGKLATALIEVIGHHWLVMLSIVVSGGLVWAGFASLFRRMDEERAGRKKKTVEGKKSAWSWFLKSALPRVAVIALAGFALYEFIIGLTLVYVLLTQPFIVLGKMEAQSEMDNDFARFATVKVKTPAGDESLREISCGPQFCALWKDKHASYAPVSTITWADAPTSDKKN